MDTPGYDVNYNMGGPTTADRNSQVFSRHTDSVLCCSIDNHRRMAVSGGIDDTAFVWDINTRHVIFECRGHKESVVAAAFSLNSAYVATGDLNGYLQVRNTTTGIRIFEYDIDEINWLIWHNTSEFVLLAGTVKGEFWMWNVNDPAAVKTFPSHGSPTTAAKLLSDGMNIVSAYGDGSIRFFDLKTKQANLQLNDPNRSEVICLDLNPNKALLAVGCIDSTVKLITYNACKVVGTLLCKSPEKSTNSNKSTSCRTMTESIETTDMDQSNGKPDQNDGRDKEFCDLDNGEPLEVVDEYNKQTGDNMEEELDDGDEDDLSDGAEGELLETDSVESVLLSPCGNYLAAANNAGSIFIWEVSSQAARCELHTGVGITRILWSDKGNLISACLDGAIRIYDINLNRLKVLEIHSDQILDIAYGNDILVTASEDKTCKSMKLNE